MRFDKILGNRFYYNDKLQYSMPGKLMSYWEEKQNEDLERDIGERIQSEEKEKTYKGCKDAS